MPRAVQSKPPQWWEELRKRLRPWKHGLLQEGDAELHEPLRHRLQVGAASDTRRRHRQDSQRRPEWLQESQHPAILEEGAVLPAFDQAAGRGEGEAGEGISALFVAPGITG